MQSCASSAEGGPDAGSRRIEYSSLEGLEKKIENNLQLSDNSWSALKLTRAIEEGRVDCSFACCVETEQHCPGVQQLLQLSTRQNEEPPSIEHFWKANTSDRGAKRNAINKNTSALWRPSFTDNLYCRFINFATFALQIAPSMARRGLAAAAATLTATGSVAANQSQLPA
jgi:hypothetical protein